MKNVLCLMAFCLAIVAGGCTHEVTMPESQQIAALDAKPHNLTAALYIPDDLKKNTEQVTSPFDTLSFPVGPRLADAFRKNLPRAFSRVVEAPSPQLPKGADILIVPEILEYQNHIPFPAYNPHHCRIIIKVTCHDISHGVVFSQTTTGNAQTGGNLFSGFKSQQLAAEAAHLAIEDAVAQAVEGLMEADEFNPGT